MNTTMKIYTEEERVFLKKVLDLLEVDFTETESTDGITHWEVSFKVDSEQIKVLNTCMKYNYGKNF